MKIIQVNGWVGRLNAPLATLIQDELPDFVCLQEAFAPNSKLVEAFKDQYGFIDELITVGQFPDTYFAAAWGYEIGGSVLDVGNIILSKYPLTNKVSLHTNGEYHIKTVDFAKSNTRIWQAAQAQLPGGRQLSVSNYQGYLTGSNSLGDATTVKTLGMVKAVLAKLPRPLIFCGDLNINPHSPALKVLDELGLENLTISHNVNTTLSVVHRAPKKDRDSVACDYIFVSPDIKVSNFEVSERLVSDHKALILEFEL